jgi:hypothetical protein
MAALITILEKPRYKRQRAQNKEQLATTIQFPEKTARLQSF